MSKELLPCPFCGGEVVEELKMKEEKYEKWLGEQRVEIVVLKRQNAALMEVLEAAEDVKGLINKYWTDRLSDKIKKAREVINGNNNDK